MVDEAKKEETEKKEAPKRKPMLLWAVIGLLTVAGMGGGAAFFFLGGSSKEKAGAEAKTPQADQGHVEKDAGRGKGNIFDLEPFVVNLADPQEIRYLKVTMKLDLTSAAISKEAEERLPEIRDSLLMLLSSKDWAGIQTLDGKMQLRDEIIQRLNTILKGPKIKTVYFTEFVAQ